MNNRYILLAADLVSWIFTPFYMPTIAFIVLLMFSYLKALTPGYKIAMILLVYLFTVLFPRIMIYIYRRINGWTKHQMSRRERRYVPYTISIICYSALLFIMETFHMPHFTSAIVAAALLIQVICAVVNNWIKISTHAAASGGVIGMLFAFSIIFNFNAINWLALCILLCGCVCTARMILRQHTYKEIIFGVLIGIASGCGAVIVL